MKDVYHYKDGISIKDVSGSVAFKEGFQFGAEKLILGKHPNGEHVVRQEGIPGVPDHRLVNMAAGKAVDASL